MINYFSMKRRSDERKSRVSWSATEDDALLKAVLEDKQDREAEGGDAEDEEDWDEIAKSVSGKTPVQCLKRYMVINRRKIDRGSTAIKREGVIESLTKVESESDAKVSSREEGKVEAVDDNDEIDDDEEKEPKRARKEGDSSIRWPQDDLDLLKKLVENYKDCELLYRVYQFEHTILRFDRDVHLAKTHR